MNMKITEEIKKAFQEYNDAVKATNDANTYDRRDKVYRNKDKMEKVLDNILMKEAEIQGRELVKELGYNPEDLRLCYKYYGEDTFNGLSEGKLNPKLVLNTGQYTDNVYKDKDFPAFLKKRKEDLENREKEDLAQRKTIKVIEALLAGEGTEFESAFDRYDGIDKEYFSNKVHYYNSGFGDNNYINFEIHADNNKATVDIHFRVKNLDKEKAAEIFSKAQKMIKEEGK